MIHEKNTGCKQTSVTVEDGLITFGACCCFHLHSDGWKILTPLWWNIDLESMLTYKFDLFNECINTTSFLIRYHDYSDWTYSALVPLVLFISLIEHFKASI